jgi:hypothetical protein
MRSMRLVIVLALATVTAGCARETAASRAAMSSAPAATAPGGWTSSLRGSRASPAVGAFVRERQAQLQHCYIEQRATQKDFAGKATIAVRLDDDGRVLGATILERSWQGDGKQVERCLLERVRHWQFPEISPSAEHAHSFSVVFSS